MVLGDIRIRMWAELGGIDVYDPGLINPASIDLRIGETIRYAVNDRWSDETEIRPEGELIRPGELILAHTLERVMLPGSLTGMLFLKSSAARMGFEHLQAGYIDPGFEGQLTLEIVNHAKWANRIFAHMRVVQLCLMETTMVRNPYDNVLGHYQYQTGPTPTREGYI